jgi:predicted O-methyltransferase YrrM
MSISGTAAYDRCAGLPSRVEAAVERARAARFACSCRPEQGELLRLLARGVGPAVIGETGTGYGVGLAWLATGAHPDAKLVSIDRDVDRAAAAAHLFRDSPAVEVRVGDWRDLRAFGPFHLLVLDGGGHGKNDGAPLEPAAWLHPGGLIVIDDFTPSTTWPPRYAGQVDTIRQHWLDHPDLRATQLNVTAESVTLLATYLPGVARSGG